MKTLLSYFWSVVTLLILCGGVTAEAKEDIPAIAAASNIKFALDEVAEQFTEQTGKQVKLSYGSSGNFVAQIKNGAPFELFLSADVKYIEQLQQSHLLQGDMTVYAYGRLALATPKSAPLMLDEELIGVAQLIEADQLKRFAIANPTHAPYGERAKEVLIQLGLWDRVQPYLIFGENATQATQFAISGSTQGGLVALSLTTSPQFQRMANYVVIPKEYHSPLEQGMALTIKAKQTARDFYAFILSDHARTIFKQYGFSLPQQQGTH